MAKPKAKDQQTLLFCPCLDFLDLKTGYVAYDGTHLISTKDYVIKDHLKLEKAVIQSKLNSTCV